MSTLDLGALVGRVILDDVSFQRTYARVLRQFSSLADAGAKASVGTGKLDASLADLGAAGDRAAGGLGRAEKAATGSAAANDKAAAAAARHAKATADVGRVMAETSTLTSRERAAVLRVTAAQDRLNAVQAGGVATTRQLAGAQASLIAAQDRVAAASRAAAAAQESTAARMNAASKKMSHSITLPVVAAAAVAVDQAAKFEKATSVYVTAAGESANNLSTVRDGIKRVAEETGTSTDQLTQGAYGIEKAGYRGASGIRLLDAAAKGAAEENAHLSDVIAGATSVMASYHLGTDKSVQVINALKTGAGEAKTSFEDYVRSLSTVIPVASAAGVGLDQVLGALSTLTQHGTTPAEATQELANTIRNLQAPSNVAVAAMNQLGISAVDVSKNLGHRGLTGTLAYIETRLPKTGLVYLDTMRHMEAGTADLTAMQAKMSPHLAALSKGFLDGTVTAKDYRTAFRGLGADGYAQGTAFLSLATKVRGYNDNIKAGTPAQKTLAAELKAVYGGATGLNTVLQLGGHNLDGFSQRSDAVARSLHNTSSEVEGWQRTSHLASIEAGRFKETLRVLAIDTGTAVLPMLTDLAHRVTGAVHSFEGLSGTQKSIVGWSVAALAAIGPILAVGSRLRMLGTSFTSFTSTASARLAAFAGASETGASRVSAAVANASRAVTGLASGALAASLPLGDSGGGVLGSILLGGAGGWAMGGPVGAAVGAVSAAIFKGIGLWGKHKEAAQQAAVAEKAYVDQLTSAIDQDNGAIGRQTRLMQNQALGKSGALALASSLHINLGHVLDASLGNGKALQGDILGPSQRLIDRQNAIQAQIAAHPNAGNVKQLQDESAAIEKTLGQYYKLQQTLGRMGIDVGKATKQWDLQFDALNASRHASGQFAEQLRGLTHQQTIAENANGVLSTSLSASTRAGQRNRATLLSLARAAQTDAEKTFDARVKHDGYASALRSAQGVLARHIEQILHAAGAAGINAKGVQALIGKYAGLPKSVVTYIRKHGVLPADIQAIIDKLNAIPTYKSVTIGVSRVNTGKGSSTYNSQVPHADGGYISGPGTGTSDSIPARLSNGEFVVRAAQVQKHRGLLEDINSGTKGFANGGLVTSVTNTVKTAKAAASHVEDLNASIRFSGVSGVAHAIQAQKGPAQAAMRDLARAVEDAFTLKGIEGKLAATRALIDKMTSFRSGIEGTLTGSYDLGASGSVSDFVSGIGAQAGQNNTFGAEINRLRRAHLNKSLLSQLIAKGPNATLDTLAHGSARDIAAANKAYAGYASSVRLAGNAAVYQQYGHTIAGEGSYAKTLERRQAVQVQSIDKLLTAITKLTGRPSEVSIDGKVIARTVVEPTVIRLMDELGNHLAYGRKH